MPLIPSDQDRLDAIIAFFRLSRPNDPTGEFTVVWPREEGVEYGVEHAVIDGRDRFLILHKELDITMAFCGHTNIRNVDKGILLPGTYPV